jgi:nitrite transporter NirC
MEQEALQRVSLEAARKVDFYRHTLEFIVYSMIAGAFCSIGMAFAYSVGSAFFLTPALRELYRVAIGVSFSLSFTLIIFAGCELFTSNVFVMSVGTFKSSVEARDASALLLLCYFSNIAGAVLMAWIIAMTGLLAEHAGELMRISSAGKISLPFVHALFRGAMCNVLVCLGYWAMSKTQSETAKLIIIVWVVAGFVTPGYEHSIANAGIFAMAFSAPATAQEITFTGALSNMLPVTIGNALGGSLLVGLPYAFSGRIAFLRENNASEYEKKKASQAALH